jgi:hypothetical protein
MSSYGKHQNTEFTEIWSDWLWNLFKTSHHVYLIREGIRENATPEERTTWIVVKFLKTQYCVTYHIAITEFENEK